MSEHDAIDKGLAEAFGGGDAPEPLRDPSGRYQVLGEIGRGGVGVVYKGRDTDLGRDVAMKVLKDELADRPDALARFVEEAQIGGQLQHPGIVPVYELGLQAGERPYFAMKLVKGETLAEQLAHRSDPAEDRRRLLGVFEQVCQTVAYAHARRVVHRDLKPANVMIGAFGEVQVVDWGLAKVLPKGGVADEVESIARAKERSVIETVRSAPGTGTDSLAGSVFGTPAYMPPEQAQGDVERLDRRSDVFGLGAILCEILTGDPPYREADGDLLRQAANAELDGAHGRLRECGADDALVALCVECLARARQARPESASELAERVGAYLTSVEERARHAELRAAEARYKTRTTRVVAATGLAVVLLGAGTWIWIDGQAQNRQAEAAQRVASAMSAASGARGKAQAQAAGLDATLWAAAVSSAEQVVTLARSDDVERDRRGDAESLLAAVVKERNAAQAEAERLERDATMLARLEDLRIPRDENTRTFDWEVREARRLDAAYDEAFAAYLGGSSVLELSLRALLEALDSEDVAVELATSLDHWSLVRDALSEEPDPPDAAGSARLRELAALLDGEDSLRGRLRRLLPNAQGEGAALRALAAEADFGAMTAAGCRVLGDALWRAGEEETSLSVLIRAQEVHPQDLDLCFRLATRYEQQPEEARWDDAIRTYRIANALRPDHLEVLHRLGYSLDKTERFVDAERIFRRLTALQPENAHWLRHIGIVLSSQGRLEEAIEAFRATIDLDPDDAHSLRDLGNALRRLGRQDEAVECFDRVREVLDARRGDEEWGREDAHSWLTLGWRFGELGRHDDALDAYRRSVELDPSVAAAHFYLARALQARGDFEGAVEGYAAVLDLEPEHLDAHLSIAVNLMFLGRLEEAVESSLDLIELNPDLPGAHNNLGLAYIQQGEADLALESLRRALELDPDLLVARKNAARAAFHSRELEEGIALFLEVLGRDAPTPNDFVVMGLTLGVLGRPDEALEVYRRALAIEPDYAPAHLNSGDVLRDRGDREEARSAYERAAVLFEEQEGEFAARWGAYARGQLERLR